MFICMCTQVNFIIIVLLFVLMNLKQSIIYKNYLYKIKDLFYKSPIKWKYIFTVMSIFQFIFLYVFWIFKIYPIVILCCVLLTFSFISILQSHSFSAWLCLVVHPIFLIYLIISACTGFSYLPLTQQEASLIIYVLVIEISLCCVSIIANIILAQSQRIHPLPHIDQSSYSKYHLTDYSSSNKIQYNHVFVEEYLALEKIDPIATQLKTKNTPDYVDVTQLKDIHRDIVHKPTLSVQTHQGVEYGKRFSNDKSFETLITDVTKKGSSYRKNEQERSKSELLWNTEDDIFNSNNHQSNFLTLKLGSNHMGTDSTRAATSGQSDQTYETFRYLEEPPIYSNSAE